MKQPSYNLNYIELQLKLHLIYNFNKHWFLIKPLEEFHLSPMYNSNILAMQGQQEFGSIKQEWILVCLNRLFQEKKKKKIFLLTKQMLIHATNMIQSHFQKWNISHNDYTAGLSKHGIWVLEQLNIKRQKW